MREINLNDYPNLLDSVSLTHFDILDQIKDYELNFINIRDEKVEWQMELPMFVTPFYKFIYLNKTIPTQNEFWDYYQSQNKNFFLENTLNDTTLLALQARLFRTYPSLVRDFHFATFLKLQLPDYNVIYNRNLDIKEGIDLLISKDDKYWAINCFASTAVALKGRVKKSYKHDIFTNVQYVDLLAEVTGARSIGNFFLYGFKQLIELKQIIK